MESGIAVANYFVDKSLETGAALTPMKLLKLVYISHGWHLGLYDQPLIAEKVQAWKFGPVVPTVYREFKEYGSEQVCERSGSSSPSGPLHDFLNRIWEVYGGYDGMQLSSMTHQPGTPWAQTVEPYGKGPLPLGLVIPNPLIGAYYKERAAHAQPTGA